MAGKIDAVRLTEPGELAGTWTGTVGD